MGYAPLTPYVHKIVDWVSLHAESLYEKIVNIPIPLPCSLLQTVNRLLQTPDDLGGLILFKPLLLFHVHNLLLITIQECCDHIPCDG